jgi:hypothetical protein
MSAAATNLAVAVPLGGVSDDLENAIKQRSLLQHAQRRCDHANSMRHEHDSKRGNHGSSQGFAVKQSH